jgi:hypothetical protein
MPASPAATWRKAIPAYAGEIYLKRHRQNFKFRVLFLVPLTAPTPAFPHSALGIQSKRLKFKWLTN